MSTNEYWNKSNDWIIHCHKFSGPIFSFQWKFHFWCKLKEFHLYVMLTRPAPPCKFPIIWFVPKISSPNRHRENFGAFTGPKGNFGLILLILNMIIHKSFTSPTQFLPVNVRWLVSLAVFVTKYWLISLCPRLGTDKPDVYGERHAVHSRFHLDLKSIFALKNNWSVYGLGSCLVRLLAG